MRDVLPLVGVCLLGACTDQPANPQHSPASAPMTKAVSSGTKEKPAFFDSINPVCEVNGYPEITVVKVPGHGSVTVDRGQDYPSYETTNVRHECDRRLLGSTQLFYQSEANFRGTDAFSIEIRFPDNNLWTRSYSVEVR